MGLRINSNIAALSSYNNLNKTDKAVSSSLEKLSSGFRINKAADDAAGLVVSEGLKSQIGGLTVAARNAQDGVNVAQTADGALSTSTDILQRMRDLAVQAANSGSQDSTAQKAANKEFSALSSELDRISKTTAFGGQQLLSGSYNGVFQVGANNSAAGDDRINIDLSSSSALFGGTTAVAPVKAENKYTISGAVAGDVLNIAASGTAPSINVTTTGTTAASTAADMNANTTFAANYSASVDTAGQLTITALKGQTGQSVTLTKGSGTGTAPAAYTGGSPAYAAPTAVTGVVGTGVRGFDSAGLGLTGIDLLSGADAQQAIDAVSNALAGVSGARASIGAVQNRFEKTIDNLNTAIQNITASNSAIRDTDMAAEMTKFTKNQVLSQAGTSMLAQANSSTQNILTLLRG